MKKAIFFSLGAVQIFVGLGAAVSGALLILVPSGEFFQMPPDMLRQTPFRDFLVPGVILFLVNGVGQLGAAVLSLRRHRCAGLAGTVFGMGLVIWIFVQVNLIGGGHLLQYGYFFLGVLETALSFLIQASPSGVREGWSARHAG